MSSRIEMTNVNKVLRKLSNLKPSKWSKDVMKDMKADHKPVRGSMRAGAPKDDGKLKKSIRTNAWMKRRRGGEVSIFVRTGPRYRKPGRVFYAHFVELGTKNNPGAYFIKDTVDQHGASVARGIKQALINAIRKAYNA